MGTKKMGSYARRKKRKALLEYWGFNGQAPCWWCLKILDNTNATIEHMVPCALNGSHEFRNLRIACKECNNGYVNPLDVKHKIVS